MKELENKKVLLIALTEYSQGIISEFIKMGASVDYLCDKPNNGFLCKVLGRMKFKPYIKVIENYYKKKISEISSNQYDYVLVIRGEYTPKSSIQIIKKVFPTTRVILYMWDSISNNKGIERTWKYYDKVWSFDRIDCLNNEKEIDFLPLFYYNSFIPQQGNEYKYDVAFIGTGHEDRVKVIREIKKQCIENGLRMYEYIFLPHKIVYLKNKLLNREYKGVRMKDIHFKLMPTEDVYKIYSESRCVVDIESKTQNGLTMRSIEMIGLKKKIITTNKDIVNYDFYNQSNIMVVNRNDFKIGVDFINNPYEDISEEIYRKYSLHEWILYVLEIKNREI